MNIKTLGVVTLRGLSTLYRLQGLEERAQALSDVAAGIESGVDVDEHMAGVAVALKTDDPNDWEGVQQRIADDRARLHG